MTTTTPQTIIDETARKLEVSVDTVRALFDFIDQLREQHGERWRTIFPCELLELIQHGTPWAAEVLGAMALMLEETFGATGG